MTMPLSSPEAAMAELPSRPRPEPGAMALPLRGSGIRADGRRMFARGYYNWRNYGKLPPAKTYEKMEIVEIPGPDGELRRVENRTVHKVFEWTGLFKDIEGQRIFVPQKGGKDRIQISEAVLDFWNRVKVRFLERKYGHLGNLYRTWKTRKFIRHNLSLL